MAGLDTNIASLAIDDEEITVRHRKERKELQAKIQSLKKTAGNDKKKKKEMLEHIAQLEADLDRRHDSELAQLEANAGNNSAAAIQNDAAVEETAEDAAGTARVSRAQKRRDKKAADEKTRQAEVLAQEELNKTGPRVLETTAIKKILAQKGLVLQPISSDGNCLYNAIRNQLLVSGKQSDNVNSLRDKTADYILANKDSLIFYMTNAATGDCLDDAGFEKYCSDVRNTPAWGGQVEITALSSILKSPIEVIQATGPATVQGEEFKGPKLVITYHRHMYSLGEHYNGTRPIGGGGGDDEEASDDNSHLL